MPARKRQRDNAQDEDDESSKRHRGRPRVNEQDETAADVSANPRFGYSVSNHPQRRRTQIRLAQRAYRQRKENTISSLQDQVSRLQSTIEDMNKAFLTLNGKLVGSSLLRMDPGLARDLRDATQQFVSLARGAGSDGAESDYSDTPAAPSSMEKVSIANILSPVPSRKVLDIGLGYFKILDGTSNESEPTQAEAPHQDHPFNGQFPLSGLAPVQALQPTKPPSPDFSFYSRLADQLPTSGFGARLPTPPPAPFYHDQYSYLKATTLQASYTFSVEETSFARRLHRAALERAFHLAATATQQPAEFDRVFRLSLLYNTREVLMTKCQSILTKGIDEPLELLQTPFISIGGAGHHYTDRLPPNSYVIKPGRAGHARFVNQETGFDAGIDVNVDLKEFEGEWFDPNDVAKFLEFLDLHIDPRSTFAETPMVTGGPLHSLLVSGGLMSPEGPKALSSGGSSINSSPRLAHIPAGTLQDGATRLFPELGLNGSEGVGEVHAAADWLLGASVRTPEFLSPTEGWNGVQPGSWPPGSLTPPASRSSKPSVTTRNLTLDVGNMIDCTLASSD
jgi:hypothetical protein